MKLSRFTSLPNLRKGISQSAGRNQVGQITVRHRGGGHKQKYRSIKWTNTSSSYASTNESIARQSSTKGIVVGFEYDPQRTAPLAQIYDKETSSFFYCIATGATKPLVELNFRNSTKKLNSEANAIADTTSVKSIKSLKHVRGDQSSMSYFEPGDFIHSVELFPGQGPTIARAAGSFCQVRSTDVGAKYSENLRNITYVKVRLPSGSQRLIAGTARATYGMPESNGYHQRASTKAGRTRWYGWRPSVRGVARNPVDHPHGGGQGKTSGGRPSVTFKAWPTKGQPTRSPKRKSAFILSKRTKSEFTTKSNLI